MRVVVVVVLTAALRSSFHRFASRHPPIESPHAPKSDGTIRRYYLYNSRARPGAASDPRGRIDSPDRVFPLPTQMKIVTALLLAAAAAVEGARRRLADQLDMPILRLAADNGGLGYHLVYKLDASNAYVEDGEADTLAAIVAEKVPCDDTAHRVFRRAGIHETAHHAAGLDLWSVTRGLFFLRVSRV